MRKSISELVEKTTPVADDLLVLVDSGVLPNVTKKIKPLNLGIGSLGASYWVVASDAPTLIITYAQKLQSLGYPVLVCDGTADDVQIQAAITALNTSGQGLVLLSGGNFACTSQILPKSSVSVRGEGRGITTVTVTLAANTDGVKFSSLTNSVWFDMTIKRLGTGTHSAVDISGTCDRTVILHDIEILNEATGSASSRGLSIQDTATPLLYRGRSKGGGNGNESGGLEVWDGAEPWVYLWLAEGSDGTTAGGPGFRIWGYCTPKLWICTGLGGSGADYAYGIEVMDVANPDLNGGFYKGGSAGANCAGGYLHGASVTHTSGGVSFRGGTTGNAQGLQVNETAQLTGGDIVCEPDNGGRAIAIYDRAIVNASNLRGTYQKLPYVWYYDDANNGRFRPFSSPAYQVLGVMVEVAVANVGVTLDIGTAAGGNQVAAAIDIGSTGYKYTSITQSEIASGGYLYATPSAPITDSDVIISYVVTRHGGGILIDTDQASLITDSLFEGSGANDGGYIDADAVAANLFKFRNCTFSTLDTTNQKSLNAQAAVTCDVYGCTFIGPKNNITPKFGGDSTGTGAQQTIAHGLSFTPLKHQIALIAGSATAAPYHSAAPDATNIYVTAVNLQAWHWIFIG